MTKQVKIQETELGNKYFHIYEVRAEMRDGKVITDDRYFSEKQAEEEVEKIYKHLHELYTAAWVRKQIVWC